MASSDFEARVRPHLEAMVAVARRVLSSDDLAWDAVQETLLRIWRVAEVPNRPKALLLRQVHLWSLHIHRTRRRRRVHEEHVCSVHPNSIGGSKPDQHDMELQEFQGQLQQIVQQMPPECREALMLRSCRELGYDEIAEKLQVPIGTVRSRLNRARAHIKRCLTALESDR